MNSAACVRPNTMDAARTRPVTVTVDACRLRVDIATVDWLARLALLSGRNGGRLVLDGVSDELRNLIEFAGLGGVLFDEPLGG
jgi:hypothetical protein